MFVEKLNVHLIPLQFDKLNLFHSIKSNYCESMKKQRITEHRNIERLITRIVSPINKILNPLLKSTEYHKLLISVQI